MSEKLAVGLDIGTTKIVAMVGRANEHGKLEVIAYGKAHSLGVHRGVVTNIVQTVNRYKPLELAEQQAEGTPSNR